ncbi:aminoacyl-histidine dipeptidase [Endozoicomonas sp. SM1973]|uniref:Cytosol non-specific dipeptidase n=1 Tax=Spartinivicinus marinus TaxID=2994442 RepID=A0A853IBN5_9GAMM|nr:aminoacyl-histidine dipeptidase [Spartinivicinus marinus]MCX4027667.1 aminoacyl-histidine dipeptidase [Spartinivicinus marinus]NYZ66635.1 aminoacyl-histidine dipeptidase [Spartinivicinus marinus]
MTSIASLTPTPLWSIFHQITQIPRPSKHEEAVVCYIESLCREHNLSYERDNVGNLIIRKPATPGMENRRGVVMQGHVDMVPQKNADSEHNFLTDPITTLIDGEWVTAKGTTLGADNGVGVAAALAVMIANDIEHGPLEVLLTIDEEAGMTGAAGLEAGHFEGDILLNMDTEDEGELYVGCAGGVDVSAKIAMDWQHTCSDDIAFEVKVTGLRGGHSGLDIDQGRGNANKIINRFLLENVDNLGVKVASFNGGTLRNAIPRESFTMLVVNQHKEIEFKKALNDFHQIIKNEYSSVEPNLSIEALKVDLPERVYTPESIKKVVYSVTACISGPARMSDEFKGVVETSNNLAIVKSDDNDVLILSLVRSLVNSARDDLANSIAATFKVADAEVSISGEYPGWKPNPNSKILTLMKERYEALSGVVPKVKVIHAGLECGLLGNPYPHWDMISFGPTIRNAHSPDEKVHIQSVSKFWDYLVDTLKHIPTK